MTKRLLISLGISLMLVFGASTAQETGADGGEASREQFRSLDQDVQALKKEVLDLNRDLFLLEEELLFPANSQVAFFISMDVGEYFELDSVSLKIDGKEVSNYLYTEREVGALIRGGVHRVHMANLKTGDHELDCRIYWQRPAHTRLSAWRDYDVQQRHRCKVSRTGNHGSRQKAAAGICYQGMGVIVATSSLHICRTESVSANYRYRCIFTQQRDDAEPITIEDPQYGEVLFYFYQEDYFPAIVRLLAAQQQEQLTDHIEQSELLLGGMYLSYGHHLEAAEIFERLLADNVRPEIRDRTWFFLAKIWNQRGYLDRAEAALNELSDELPITCVAKPTCCMHRFSSIAVVTAKLSHSLQAGKARPEWASYAKFNLGVALVRNGDVDTASGILNELGSIDPHNEELTSLRDKANLALGYSMLQDGQPTRAKEPLQRVRLEGPFSNKALLGVGWADAELENYGACTGALDGAPRSGPARFGCAGIDARHSIRARETRFDQPGSRPLPECHRGVLRRNQSHRPDYRVYRVRRNIQPVPG